MLFIVFMKIKGFKCSECGEVLDQGLCGNHRIETGHSEFEPLWEDEDDTD